MLDLFADAEPWQESLAPGATILRRFALSRAAALSGFRDVMPWQRRIVERWRAQLAVA